MEGLPSPYGSAKHTNSRKASSSNSQKDLWTVVREGSLSELESALLILKKNGGNIDARNAFGLTPLHIATWRNNVPIVKRLIAAGADPNARDGESGWSSLHRALHFGHLAVASVLLQSCASLTIEDSKSRIPADLLSGPVSFATGTRPDSASTEVFSWGSGTNYQLGTGNAHIQKLLCKVDTLQGSCTRIIAAAKFHSVAVGAAGELYTWGYGRGGRLGHPDFDIHSGQAAVITPRQVTVGLGSRCVKAVAVAKHHTIIAVENGEVFTWGSNREGQLGYPSVDTQPTPRRVSSLRYKIIAVAAANKHSAAVADTGEVLTWGCNREGQLGYGTSNSASNYTPRVVDYLKGKSFEKISASKYHTIALTAEGEVFTWGHRLVTPRRVVIARNLKKSGNVPLRFHRMERIHAVAIAAGMTHSTALTDDGTLFYWVSADPDLRCQQLSSICGKNIVSISAGKYWTAAVTDSGDVYMWDGKKQKGEAPIPTRLHGVKRATSIAVGETHLLVLSALYHPVYPPKVEENQKAAISENDNESEELDGDFMFDESKPDRNKAVVQEDCAQRPIPSLKSLCEKIAIKFLLEPRNAIQLLEVADSLGADELRMHCEEIAIRNLDFIFTVSHSVITNASLEVLSMLEKSLDAKSSESWSHRRLPTPTATFPAVIGIEDEGLDNDGCLRLRDNNACSLLQNHSDARMDSFLSSKDFAGTVVSKQVRALRKKLQQIEMLENKQSNGHNLDDQQLAKLRTKHALESALAELGFPVAMEGKLSSSDATDGKDKKAASSRKQRRKGKRKEEKIETVPLKGEAQSEQCLVGAIADLKSIHIPKEKEIEQFCGEGEVSASEGCIHKTLKGTPKKSSNNESNLKPTQSRRKNKKGGLSMFLSGALDDSPKVTPSPPPPKKEGPAWGGIQVPKGATSLRVILDEQSKTNSSPPIKMQKDVDLADSESSNQHLRLSSFMTGLVSSPVAVVPACTPQSSEGEKSTPPWSSAGTPTSCRPSLRDIQMQEGNTVFYKNLLLELIKKEGFSQAEYVTVCDGPPHMPLFASTVEIEGEKFKGMAAKRKKQAEQNASKVAWTALKERKDSKQGHRVPSNFKVYEYFELSPPRASIAAADVQKPQASTAEDVPMDIDNCAEDQALMLQKPSQVATSIVKDPNVCQSSSSSDQMEVEVKPEQRSEGGEGSALSVSELLKSAGEASMPLLSQVSGCTTDLGGGTSLGRDGGSQSCIRIQVHPRRPDLKIPKGATVLPMSDDKWVAMKFDPTAT